MERIEQAVANYQEGFSCAQSILAAYAREFNLDRETAFRLAAAFGGGIARQGETCGAVTGALMVIGLKHGLTNAGDQVAKDKTHAAAQKFLEEFRLRNRTTDCKDMLGVDISNPDGYQFARERNLFHEFCPGYVRDAAEILETLLTETNVG